MCVCETFLRDDQTISVEGYSWYGNNRKSISKRALRVSGGVGVLVKQSLLDQYTVVTLSDEYDGILWLKLLNRQNGRQVGICICYFPPIGSSRGNKSPEFFDTLKALIIDNYQWENSLYVVTLMPDVVS